MISSDEEMVGQKRQRLFLSIILREGLIKRGSLISKMYCSQGTFAHEYRDYLESYPNVKYDKKTREFTYQP